MNNHSTISLLYLIAALIPSLYPSISIHTESSLRSCISDLSPTAIFINSEDLSYEDMRIGDNYRYDNIYPLLIVEIHQVSDISASIKCADRYHIEIIPSNGGHSFEGLSTTSGLLLHLNSYNNVVDSSLTDDPTRTSYITVQSGMRLGKLYGSIISLEQEQNTEKSYLLGAGTCPTVGVTGHVLCGGYGYLGRELGLTSDQVLGFEVVTPTGDVIEVNDNVNPDLFWALRGSCSSSFGIVSTITFKLAINPDGNKLTTIIIPPISNTNDMKRAVRFFQEYSYLNAPNKLTMTLFFWQNGWLNLHGVYIGSRESALDATLDDISLGLSSIYSKDNIRNYYQERTFLSTLAWWGYMSSSTTVEDLLSINSLPSIYQRTYRRKSKSILIDRVIDDSAVDYIIQLFNEQKLDQFQFKAYGGRLHPVNVEIDPDTGDSVYTSYTYPLSPLLRGHGFELHFGNAYSMGYNPSRSSVIAKDEALVTEINDIGRTLQSVFGMSSYAYVGYIDLDVDSSSSSAGALYFGQTNFLQLESLRKSFDPENILASQASNYLYVASTSEPSFSPTKSPTSFPTPPLPTRTPTILPTWRPSTFPTYSPTYTPTTVPTKSPTFFPTPPLPTHTPTILPTWHPSTFPTYSPPYTPTTVPTKSPTFLPTPPLPTHTPTILPAWRPSTFPTCSPTSTPTTLPTKSPTFFPTPTSPPTILPTFHALADPTCAPTSKRSLHPTAVPLVSPTSSSPTSTPSLLQPSFVPSAEVIPSGQPTAIPLPTVDITSAPSGEPTRLTLFPSSTLVVPTVLPSSAGGSENIPSVVPSTLQTESVRTLLPSMLSSLTTNPSMTPSTVDSNITSKRDESVSFISKVGSMGYIFALLCVFAVAVAGLVVVMVIKKRKVESPACTLPSDQGQSTSDGGSNDPFTFFIDSPMLMDTDHQQCVVLDSNQSESSKRKSSLLSQIRMSSYDELSDTDEVCI